MLSERWERFLSIITRYEIKPILAVIPNNQDPALGLQEPDPGFWERMRSLEAAGATIAMHGYRHLCASRGKPLLKLHLETEFAGVDESQQRQWIRAGLDILRGNGLNPRLFVAPRHGFDRTTLRALASEGLGILSDGFARRPFMRYDVFWIPQQLWEPVRKKTGLWTICIHTNTATPSVESKLERFLAKHAHQFTTFGRVIADNQPTQLRWNERVVETLANLRVRISAERSRRKQSASS
jgi:peptidoglycan/xylan/chitin deacetylase (PgdA/CDA1 family)